MKILIGVDDSRHSKAAVEFVRKMTWPQDSTVIVLSVVQPVAPAYAEVYAPTALPNETMEDMTRMHHDIASNAERTLQVGNLTTESKVLQGDPRTTLIETAYSEHADLIVVGSHGRTGLAKLLIGSVANHVVTHAPCSVLVVKLEKR